MALTSLDRESLGEGIKGESNPHAWHAHHWLTSGPTVLVSQRPSTLSSSVGANKTIPPIFHIDHSGLGLRPLRLHFGHP